MKNFVSYMKFRSKIEGVKFKMSEGMLEGMWSMGMRNFFGVDLDESKNPVSDWQNPGAFQKWKTK